MKALVILLLFTSAAFGAELSLTELVDLALKNNPQTEKVWWNTKRSQAALGIAKSSYYAHLDATGNVNHGREVKYPNGPNTNYTFYSAELCMSYLLYDFGARGATVRATKDALKATMWSGDFAVQRVVYRVAAHYYEYLYALEVLHTRESSLSDANLILCSAEELHKRGLRAITDLSTSRAAVAQMQIDLAHQKAQVAIAYGKLMTTLGVPIESKIEVQGVPEDWNSPELSQGVNELIALADSQRVDLMAKKANVAEMDERLTRAKRNMLPKFRGLGQIGWLEYTKHQGSGYNYNVGVALDVPIFSGFEKIYQKRLAYADAELSRAELKELEDAIALEILSHSQTVNAAREALKWSEQFLSETSCSYECSMESYKAGLQSIFDLIQSQRYLTDARLRKAQAKTQWLVSLAELAFATGSLNK